MTKMAAMSIYAKKLKDLLWNQQTGLFKKYNSLWPDSCYMLTANCVNEDMRA